MKVRNLVVLLVIAIAALTSCGKSTDEVPKKDATSIDDVASAITAEMKAHLISAGVPEEDFTEGSLPSYSIMRLKDENFQLPIEYDKNKLEDALVITHNMNVKSDMIVVLKVKTEADIPAVENYAKMLRDEQYRTWETYLPDQFEKVQQNTTKTFGRYVVYITHDEPQKISTAVEKLFR